MTTEDNLPLRVHVAIDANGNRIRGMRTNGLYLRRSDAEARARRAGGTVKTFELIEEEIVEESIPQSLPQ